MQTLNHELPAWCLFQPVPESVSQARKWLRSLLYESPGWLPSGTLDPEDLEVVVSELATNAVRAAAAVNRQGSAWSYRLVIDRTPTGFCIDVTDPSPAIPLLPEPTPTALDLLTESGRGLPMLRAYGFTWHALQQYHQGSKTIRYQLSTSPTGGLN
ncbi:ATP-binding protein [Kitasatospora acidiphila]|nr:ATP-binding protein [Kitasatospora acidiphila]